jgi:hypothetical protein
MMAAPQQEAQKAGSFIVQCSADTFEHATWLSAVFSEVLAVNEQAHRLQITQISDTLRRQFDKLGAQVREAVEPFRKQPCQI